MAAQARDPYQTLGITPGVSDEEVRKAYRRLVQKYHPDHNGGSEESERRFEEVQEAYAKIRELRKAPQRSSVPLNVVLFAASWHCSVGQEASFSARP